MGIRHLPVEPNCEIFGTILEIFTVTEIAVGGKEDAHSTFRAFLMQS